MDFDFSIRLPSMVRPQIYLHTSAKPMLPLLREEVFINSYLPYYPQILDAYLQH